jgi:hypothetical protein
MPCRRRAARYGRAKPIAYQADPDLQAMVDSGRGDVPLIELHFRCSNCGSRLTDFVVTSGITRSRGDLSPKRDYAVTRKPPRRTEAERYR